MRKKLDTLFTAFLEKPKDEQERLIEQVAIIITTPISTKLYRRWGATKWQARAIVAVATRLYLIEQELKRVNRKAL